MNENDESLSKLRVIELQNELSINYLALIQ